MVRRGRYGREAYVCLEGGKRTKEENWADRERSLSKEKNASLTEKKGKEKDKERDARDRVAGPIQVENVHYVSQAVCTLLVWTCEAKEPKLSKAQAHSSHRLCFFLSFVTAT